MTQPNGRNKTARTGTAAGGGKLHNQAPMHTPKVFEKSQNRGDPPQADYKPDRGSMTPTTAPVRICFLCNSPLHLLVNCHKRATGAKHDKIGSSAQNACTVGSVSPIDVCMENQLTTSLKGEPSYDESVNDGVCDTNVVVNLEPTLISENVSQVSEKELINTTDDSVGHLSFCDVEIKGLPGYIPALDDSGTQMSLVNPKVTENLDLPRFGKVVVRGDNPHLYGIHR